ncbi:hypothetical protein A1O1_04699 [Capronia coronata CBS 617.96]|uniref:Protein Mpv17 n=1 Tax=Capronia coronata CBS 617.96 TaxID=1182541 RepID=W9Y4M0_9EURO|nr:uncharacterized protein A1O1_04699 [Capronia coronata CBS 617.96]EXJ87772.1 hypothetical protein A1O1_04699 [Capronia coronata CBS 617.96]
MPSLTTVTIQSALLKSAANLTAQVAARWNSPAAAGTPVDWTRVAEFAVFGLVQAPIVSMWQVFLEDNFPSQRASGQRQGRVTTTQPGEAAQSEQPTKDIKKTTNLNWANILTKLVVDQTIGQLIMALTFLVCTRGARLGGLAPLREEIRTQILGIVWASWKIWPWVALINFIWIPVEWRVVVASVVGFGWNVFLSILSMSASA